jgi:CRP-like cAMP-binding protein
MNLEARLSRFPNFAHFGAESLSLFASALEVRAFAEGDVILEEGSAGSDLYILLEGRVAVVKKEVGKLKEVGADHPGQLAGLMTLLLGTKRTATVRAIDDVKVAVLTRYAFDLLYRHDGPASQDFCQAVSRQLVDDARTIHDAFFEHEEVSGRSDDIAELQESQSRLNKTLHTVQSMN